MRFEVLGPVRVRRGGVPLRVGGPRERKALAALLLQHGRPLPSARLAAVLWADAPPPTSAAQIHNSIAALRRALGAEAPIARSGSGFRLDLTGHEFDLSEFTALAAEADRLADPTRDEHLSQAAARYRAALDLWQGPALDGLADGILAAEARRLEELRLACLERRLAVELAGGRHAELAGELAALADEHPLREKLVELRMRALCRSGRRPEALAAYADLRGRLAEELGLDPSPELQRLHTAILRDQPLRRPDHPHGAGPATGVARREVQVPRQLPAGTRHFVGRTDELRALDRLADTQDGRAGVVICAIAGTAGVGKTALAVHWAHRNAHRFPDGQLYLDLRGHDAAAAPVAPGAALGRLLEALALHPERIPAGPDARAALYRSVLSGRRALVVLDNARDADQARPLLPGTAGCLVVVTSRVRLTDLVAGQGAHPVHLGPLSDDEAHQMLCRYVGAERVGAEPEAAAAIVKHCAHLPLAVAVAAAQAAVTPGASLAGLAAGIADPVDRLDRLDGGGRHTGLRAVFSWSYRELSGPARRLFRLWAVHPGPEVALAAVASLLGVDPRVAGRLVAELVRAHLVGEGVPGRYTCHDLLRAYAAELPDDSDGDEVTDRGGSDPTAGRGERAAAWGRLFAHYLHTAYAADRLLYPQRTPVPVPSPPPGVTAQRLADHRQAQEWLGAERSVLAAVVAHGAAAGCDEDVWHLVWALVPYLHYQAHWPQQADLLRVALDAAVRLGDAGKQAWAHRQLGLALAQLGLDDLAYAHHGQALDLCQRLDDRVGAGVAHLNLTWVLDRQSRHSDALRHALLAAELLGAAGHQVGRANALNAAGWYHCLLGEPGPALDLCTRALRVHQRLGDRHGQAAAWDTLGSVHHHLGEHGRAAACYREALAGGLGRGYELALTLRRLGDTLHAAGDDAGARRSWRQALEMLEQLDHPEAGPVRARLATPGPGPARHLSDGPADPPVSPGRGGERQG